MKYGKSLSLRIVAYCSRHYLRLLGLSVLLLGLVSFHKVIPMLSHPVIAYAETGEDTIGYRYNYDGQRQHDAVHARKIEFNYNGQKYSIIGGLDEGKGSGLKTQVIFQQAHPDEALEFTFLGMMDFPVVRFIFQIWFFLTAGLYAIATLDKHFDLFDIDFKKMTKTRFWIIALILIALPLIKNARTLILGKNATGLITGDVIFYENSWHRSIKYEVDGRVYSFAALGNANDEPNMIGTTIPILYDRTKPEEACTYDLISLYSNGWNIPMGMGLIFLTGWYFATRDVDNEFA